MKKARRAVALAATRLVAVTATNSPRDMVAWSLSALASAFGFELVRVAKTHAHIDGMGEELAKHVR